MERGTPVMVDGHVSGLEIGFDEETLSGVACWGVKILTMGVQCVSILG